MPNQPGHLASGAARLGCSAGGLVAEGDWREGAMVWHGDCFTIWNKGEIPMTEPSINQADLVFGIIEAAKYLGTTKKTVHVMINEGIFPQPVILQNIGKRVIKLWKKSDLDRFKPNLRPPHRPKSVT